MTASCRRSRAPPHAFKFLLGLLSPEEALLHGQCSTVSGQVMALKMKYPTKTEPTCAQEVQLMNRLSTLGLYQFIEVSMRGSSNALTEYINGGNLEQLLGSEVYLPWSVRLSLAWTSPGTAVLYSKGIFHRDPTW
ncbi:dual specificity testis-specific protein kinase 2 [Lates japonicus]|uniref:Dual specificity testis-specific protein kinase 2 n=1 Tax=Lates japonicus TaxID=270547 RepID=A0AAD3MHD2_LATJO|nr:dual specificity testis-specific protein kinase 2 [Lates japonicus]